MPPFTAEQLAAATANGFAVNLPDGTATDSAALGASQPRPAVRSQSPARQRTTCPPLLFIRLLERYKTLL